MLFLGIFSFLTAVALPFISIPPYLYIRIASILLLYTAFLSFNSFKTTELSLAIYHGLFQITDISQWIDTFIFFPIFKYWITIFCRLHFSCSLPRIWICYCSRIKIFFIRRFIFCSYFIRFCFNLLFYRYNSVRKYLLFSIILWLFFFFWFHFLICRISFQSICCPFP